MGASIWSGDEIISAKSSVKVQAFVASAGQETFDITGFAYEVGTGSLHVYRSGAFQRIGTDFTEESTTSFKFTEACSNGTIVVAVGFTEVSAVVGSALATVFTPYEIITANNVQEALEQINDLFASYQPAGDYLETADIVNMLETGDIGTTVQAYNATLAALAAGTTTGLGAISGIGNGRATDITISSAGEVTMPLQPAFLAYNSATDSNVTGDNTSYTVICDTEVFDQGGDYNNGTGVFTAPVTGRYRFTARALVAELAAAHVIHEINLSTSNRSYSVQDVLGSNPYTQRQLEINVLADMDAGDTASFAVVIRSGTKVVDVYGSVSGNFTMFSGELVA